MPLAMRHERNEGCYNQRYEKDENQPACRTKDSQIQAEHTINLDGGGVLLPTDDADDGDHGVEKLVSEVQRMISLADLSMRESAEIAHEFRGDRMPSADASINNKPQENRKTRSMEARSNIFAPENLQLLSDPQLLPLPLPYEAGKLLENGSLFQKFVTTVASCRASLREPLGSVWQGMEPINQELEHRIAVLISKMGSLVQHAEWVVGTVRHLDRCFMGKSNLCETLSVELQKAKKMAARKDLVISDLRQQLLLADKRLSVAFKETQKARRGALKATDRQKQANSRTFVGKKSVASPEKADTESALRRKIDVLR